MTAERRTNDWILSASVRVPQHVVHRVFPNETVVLNLQTGVYHGLNPTGARMLEELERASNVREAAAALAGEYGHPVEEVEADLCGFCTEMLDRGLIEMDDNA
jgi:hypothetical protein